MSDFDVYIGDSTIIKYCSWLLVIFLLLNAKNAFQKEARGGTGYVLLFIVMTLYCVFYCPESGDNFFSMANYYSYLDGTDWEKLHFERIYFYIMDYIPYGYVYYRLFVWGVACLLCVWLMKKMEIKSQIATLSVLTFALPILLYYQRAAFAYVLLYVALFCYESKGDLFVDTLPFVKKYYVLLSVVLFLCVIPFHNAMPIYLTFLLCALLTPKNLIGLVALGLGLYIFSESLISNSISLLEFFREDTIETGMRSLEGDTAIIGQNFNGALVDFLKMFPLYAMLVYGLYMMIQYPNHQTDFEKVCLVNTFILLLISTMFMEYSYTIQIKFRNAAMMPWTLYVASYFTRYSGGKVCSAYAITTIFTFFI